VLAHNVFFTLNDNSAPAVESLLAGCQKYLTGHPGVKFYAAGTRTVELTRPVNDQAFDVALVVVFENLAAHDEYQKSERHLAFIADHKANWKQVRVFDADVES
jgi:heme-degrading monooxygenase HmoA